MYDEPGMARTGHVLAATAAGAICGAIVGLLDGPAWLAVVLAAYAAGVSVGVPPMLAGLRMWRHDLARWSAALVDERVADHAHILVRGVQRSVGEAAELIEPVDGESAERLRGELARLRVSAEATLVRWRDRASVEAGRASEAGYMGGLAMIAHPRSSTPLRRFATYQNTPGWLPRPLRASLLQILRGVDVVRLLHTPEIERRSLIVSLWLRVAFVAVAPLMAGASLTGAVPFTGTGLAGDATWVVVLAFAGATAMGAGHIADYTIGQPTRWPLYVTDQALVVMAVLAAPCWPIAIFGAGAVNWLERPNWTLRRLVVWMAVTYGALAVGAAAIGATPQTIALEMSIGIAVTAVMAGSYGLMLPATVATFVGALVESISWRQRAVRAVRRDRRDADRVVDQARRQLLRVRPDDPSAASVQDRLRVATSRLDEPSRLLDRRPRTLAPLCSRALTSVVAPMGLDLPADGTMRSVPIATHPLEVGRLVLQSGRVGRRLERLLKRVALEAIDNGGREILFCQLGIADGGRVLVTVGNGLPSQRRSERGFQTGEKWLHRWRAGIPGCTIAFRGEAEGCTFDLPFDVFLVQLTLGTRAFRPMPQGGS